MAVERRPKRRRRRSPHRRKLQRRFGKQPARELDGDQDNPPWITRSCGLNRTTAPRCTPALSPNMLTAALISTSISCGEAQFSAERRHCVYDSRKRTNPTGFVPGRLIEFSFYSLVEFRSQKLQSHDIGAPDDLLRHAADH